MTTEASSKRSKDATPRLRRMGVEVRPGDAVLALAGNPNTGKSTVFNALTGLRQHTGNWPGKTVARAEGGFHYGERRYKVVDLPGTYSLLSASEDEEIARNFILFGRPDCLVVVVDATCLERNLNLVLQVLQITDRVVVALNLMDEAERKGIVLDPDALGRELGVPVVPVAARFGRGIDALLQTVDSVVSGEVRTRPLRLLREEGPLLEAVEELSGLLRRVYPDLPNIPWIALRLLDGDARIREAVLTGEWGGAVLVEAGRPPAEIIERAQWLRGRSPVSFHEAAARRIYAEAERITRKATLRRGRRYGSLDRRIDAWLTSPWTGFPIMAMGLALVFWLTIVGSNYPSAFLADLFFGWEAWGGRLFEQWGAPAAVTGFFWHGMFRGLAWVVSVMLPPMAIFFPLFTLLEDLGYLPRVAFNMDGLFKRCGAHGKQALTMSMGFGCNAAGVIACRIIESPRERLIAILTNNFVPCNGRFPTLIMLASVFVAGSVPPALASAAAAGAVVGVVLIGVAVTLLVSAVLSRTVLKGEASIFSLELPPYRRPNLLRILYTSIIDRTIFVLGRAVVMAAPAGAVIWLMSNTHVGAESLTAIVSGFLDPFGRSLGLDGVILLAYIIAIPANEIIVPTILMAYAGARMMVEVSGTQELAAILVTQQHWTLLTAACLMLFSLLHNPCSTTIWTIWRETRSVKWTTTAALMPLGIAFLVTFTVASLARLWSGG